MNFSIIVPFNNTYELMTHFIENLILHTDFSQGELVLISDACKDRDTLLYLFEKAKHLPYIQIIELQHQSGYSKANNIGVHACNGKVLVFLNSDVFPTHGSVNELVHYVETHPEVGAVQGKLVYPQNGLIQSTGHLFFEYTNRHIYTGCSSDHPMAQHSASRQALTTAFCAMPKNLFYELGGFDEVYYNAYEGMELTLRVSHSGKNCLYFADAVAFHAVGGTRDYIDFDDSIPGHIFWERWKKTIRTDIHKYLAAQITNEMLENTYFLIQGSSIPGWKEIIDKLGLRTSGQIELHTRFSKQIDLYRSLPYAALSHPQPYLFTVDELCRIQSNLNWAKIRNNPKDLVIDSHGLVQNLHTVVKVS